MKKLCYIWLAAFVALYFASIYAGCRTEGLICAGLIPLTIHLLCGIADKEAKERSTQQWRKN